MNTFGFVDVIHKIGNPVFYVGFDAVIYATPAIHQVVDDKILPEFFDKSIIKFKPAIFLFQQIAFDCVQVLDENEFVNIGADKIENHEIVAKAVQNFRPVKFCVEKILDFFHDVF